MEKTFRQIIKEYFNFSKKDRNAVLALAAVIVFFIAGKIVLNSIELKPSSDFSEIIAILEEWETETGSNSRTNHLFRFNPNTISEEALDSLNLPGFVKRNILNYRAAGGEFNEKSDVRKIYGMNDSIFAKIENYIDIPLKGKAEPLFPKEREIEPELKPFDPNTAGENDLLRIGFSSFQASNLVKYRENGGNFSRREDLLKIYGIDSAFFKSIEEFVTIVEEPGLMPSETDKVLPVIIELNSTDSIELQKLNGIGPAYARRILSYRELLGGFYTINQLLEVYGFPEETFYALKENIIADSMKIKKIRINFAGYAELLRHPYFKKEQVEAILNYRQKKGPFSSIEQLLAEELIDSTNFVVLRPYLTCR